MQGRARKSTSEKATEVKESLVCALTKLWSVGGPKISIIGEAILTTIN